MENQKCRMCEREVNWDVVPVDGLCSQCHISLCQKGLGKCVRCAKIMDGMVDDIFGHPFKEDEDGA